MTAVLDTPTDTTDSAPEGETAEQKAKRERDFSKFTDKHSELAEFINSNDEYKKAELAELTPGQVKAVLALRTDFTNTPEQEAARAERKAKREADKAQYEGLSEDQIKLVKQAQKAEAEEAKLEERIAEAKRKAAEFRAKASGSGEDLAAAVEAQEGSATKSKRPSVKK